MKPLSELFSAGAGKTMSAAARSGENRVPFLRTSNVLWDRLDLSSLDEMALSSRDVPDKLVEQGDLLVCEGGEIGRAAIWDGSISPMAFQNHLHRLRPLRDDVNPRFYVFFLQAAFTQLGIFEGAGNKTTIPNLSSSRLMALEVPHPDLREQDTVVRALSLIRAAIENQRCVIEVGNELKQAVSAVAFSVGLTDRRPAAADLDDRLGGWTVVALGDVADLGTGTTPSTGAKHYYEGTIPFLKTSEIVNNRLRSASTFVSRQAVIDYSLKLYPPGTLLMAMYDQGKTRGQVSLLEIAATTTQNAAAIQPRAQVDATFLWHNLRYRYEELRGMGSLGHLSHLNLGYLRDLPIALPPMNEQIEIAASLDVIDQKVEIGRRRQRVLEELFHSVLHKVMTGAVRIDDLNLSMLPAEQNQLAEATA